MRKIFLGYLVLNLLLEGLAAAVLIFGFGGILLTFHAMVFVSLAMQGVQPQAMTIHGVMAALAILLYSQRARYTT